MLELKPRLCTSNIPLGLACAWITSSVTLGCQPKVKTQPPPLVSVQLVANHDRLQTLRTIAVSDVDDRLSLAITGVEQEADGRLIAQLKVTDPNGAFVTGLAKSCVGAKCPNWRVEGHCGEEVEVEQILESNAPPVAVATVLDFSGSMVGREEQVIAGMQQLTSQIRPQRDELSVTLFGGGARVVQDLVKAPPLSLDFLATAGSEFGGGTELYDSMALGLTTLIEAESELRLLVVLTDGEDNSSIRHAPASVVELASSIGAHVIGIGIGSADLVTLEAMGSATGGYAYPQAKVSGLEGIYNDVIRVHRDYYRVIFEPCAEAREVTVELVRTNMRGNREANEVSVVLEADLFDSIPPAFTALAVPVVYFPFGSDDPFAELGEYESRRLDDLVTLIECNPTMYVHLDGYADSRGKDDYNVDLSRRRVENSRDLLIERGIEPSQIHLRAHGELRADYPDEELAHEHRRVDASWSWAPNSPAFVNCLEL